eukprot:505933-Prymnesium_polylepis.2
MVPIEVADMRKALANMGGSHSVFQAVVHQVSNLSTAQLVAALDAGDLPAVRRAAHKLSGTASYVCANSVRAAYQELDTFAREAEHDPEGVRHLAQTLLNQFVALKASLASLKPPASRAG